MYQLLLPFAIIAPPLVYGIFTLWCGTRFFTKSRTAATSLPPVTIIKPVKGADVDSLTNFTSFCRQDYPCFQILFAVASPDDPILPVIARLTKEHPEVDITLVVNPAIHGPNYKVCNLINAYPEAKHNIIVVCDSDIRVEAHFLQEIVSHFQDPEVGLVTSLYRSSGVSGITSAIEATGFTCEMVPNVLAAQQLEGLSFALGASMAVRREALDKIGGFQSLVEYLADDYQLGNMVHRTGYRIALSGSFVESVMAPEQLGTVLCRQLRWARTMRVSRPWGYLASGVTLPFPAALLALTISACSWSGYAAVLVLYCSRALMAIIYSRHFVKDYLFPKWLWLLPVRDLLASITWGLAFSGNTVHWRGHKYRIRSGGKIDEI
jgi:ceramide glucosyltransferase